MNYEDQRVAAIATPKEKNWFGHPRGLTILFLTEMWAEFSYFGLQALLVYYMTQHLGFAQGKSSLIYGIYGATAFFSPFFGGLICDRWLGRKRGVVIGGVMMMAGHFAMAFEPLLVPALALVALGNGLFVPPLAVQVGALYKDGDPRQAQAFSAYYMGINLGAVLAPLVCGTLGETLGWHWGFAAAGIGMGFGLIIYVTNPRLLPAEPDRDRARKHHASHGLSALEWDNLRLLLVIIATIVLFRIGYEQSGNVIALWVAHQTDRHLSLFGYGAEMPATWFQSINPLIIIVGTPLMMRFWTWRAQIYGKPNLLRRMGIGCLIATAAMLVMVLAAHRYMAQPEPTPVSAWWVIGYFCLLTLGEMMIIPIGLTLVDRLAPMQIAAMCMGAWYIAKFAGSLLAGVMGAYWGVVPPTLFFAVGAVAVFAAMVILFIVAKRHAEAL